MATFDLMMASLRIDDIPLYYTPPVGPIIEFTLAHNEIDDSQPTTTPAHSHVGKGWVMDWITYVVPVAEPLTNASVVRVQEGSGGYQELKHEGNGLFGPHHQSYITITKTGDTYTRRYPNGWEEVFDTPDNPADPTRIFLTRRKDPHGNALTFTYDANLRLVSITDAIDQVTNLDYEGTDRYLPDHQGDGPLRSRRHP